MLEIPDAEPTCSGSTDAVEPADAGPLATPRPMDRRIIGPTNATYSQEASTNASTAKPIVARRKPSATARPAPIFPASGVIAGVMAIIAAAAGSVARPASNGLIPNALGFWK